ncbi:triphosphoribosyl-dephospho-CoA synthase [Undibacterium sp.]|jgi:triphosphoribosyl-dephospho-CoA synthase|uniref:triphosphoribosyl-dephospho-CoA synthase n=1 Tax=Undibacterium sp. TaxID=1914977 RepID=UPI002CA3543E|nr:triphosphoribosyl-dephospho-CoA synthase [Undibacterium sp.]HTD03734.1 triphosphoribosyl-dephospho-CoA synthase [Undibacterium sp.]
MAAVLEQCQPLARAASVDHLAVAVVTALIDEATLTPKPGLVDMRGRGAHRDLNWDLMCHSAWALHPTFHAMATAGQNMADPQQLREQIGLIGRQGEAAMMAATGGINTHRGAIWALGLLVTAAAQDSGALAPASVAARAAALARRHDRFAPTITGNKGERACRQYSVGGARAQAQAGFPHVIKVALPCLERSRARGDDENAARLNALLAVVADLDDTCVLSRGGQAALTAVQSGALRVLTAGGAASSHGSTALQQFEQELLALHVSPGGAADLLAAALFLDGIRT